MSDYIKDMFIEVREKPVEKVTEVTPKLLMKLIEEILEVPVPVVKEERRKQKIPDKLTIDLIPTLPITEIGWGSLTTPDGEGKMVRLEAGQQLATFLNNIAPGGDMKAKIVALNEYYANPMPDLSGTPGEQIARTISNLVFYKTLTNIITNFNASSAGFAFESFLAVLLDAETGRQIPASEGSTIADIVLDKGGRPISLKLYREGSLKVGGSYKQLVQDLTGKYPVMEYIVVTKDLSGSGLEQTGDLNFYGFNFTLNNFLQILALKPKELELLRIPSVFRAPIEELERRLQEGGDLKSFLEIPAATFVDLAPIIQNYADAITAALKKANVQQDMYGHLSKYMDMKTGQLAANPKIRFGYFSGNRWPRGILKTIIADLPLEADQSAVLVNIMDAGYEKALAARKKAGGRGSARKAKFKELKFMTAKQSYRRLLELQQKASPELFQAAMASTEGYLKTKQFELSKGDLGKLGGIEDQENLYPYGDFAIGTIQVGAKGLQDMLDASIGEVNNAIFAIFNDLKNLSSHLNEYVAGGLIDDAIADEAQGEAENIAAGTEEIRNPGEGEQQPLPGIAE